MTNPHPRLDELQVKHVLHVPRPLEHGVLYVSEQYGVSLHLCACGCGEEVVLPFRSPVRDWTKTETREGIVTMRPSVGNQQYRCRSHYYITENRVEWLPPFA